MRVSIFLNTATALLFLACGGGQEVPLSSTGSGGGGGTVQEPPAPGGTSGAGAPTRTSASAPQTDLTLENFPSSRIVSGGPPKDGIPALTNPEFVPAAQVSYLQDSDLVLGVVVNGEAKAYPHNIGWWHEIVNDVVGGHPVSVTFCPLTGTGLVFDARSEGGRQFELGVSGLLYNNNLIMYDRRDGTTLYPQMLFTAVEGPRRGERLELLPVVEATWAAWKKLYPQTTVVARGTYAMNRYTSYPYTSSRLGDYRTSNEYLLFDLTPSLGQNANPHATVYEVKDRLLGIRLNNQSKAYLFGDMGARNAINDWVGGQAVVVVWDRDSELAIPYFRQVGEELLHFDVEPGAGFPFGLKDRETGSVWSIKGEAISGPLAGKRLVQVPAHNGFWFAWVSFWQETQVWQ